MDQSSAQAPDLEAAADRFWAEVHERLRQQGVTRPERLIEQYKNQVRSQGIDMGLVYHAGVEAVACGIAAGAQQQAIA